MVRTSTHRVIAAAVVAGAMVFPAAPAWAVPRYASPMGSSVSDCSQATPCDIKTAIEGAADGDEVILAPGNYGSPAEPLASEITAAAAVAIHGPAGGPRPRVWSFSDSVIAVGPAAALRDVEIQHSGAFNALYLGGLAERVYVQSQAAACTLEDGGRLLDSVCWSTQDAPAVRMMAAGVTQLPLWTGSLRNATAYSRLGEGIRVTADNFARLTINATNVIARGGFRDVRAEIVGTGGERSADVNLDHSNFATRLQAGGGLVTAPGSGANQTASPMFVDDPLGDFHQLPGSPTINAGVTDAANGAADFDGQARAQETSSDIGADEFPAGPPPPVPVPVPVAPRSARDRTKPVLSGFTVRPFKRRRGARVRYRLSETATVTFKFERRVRGRRQGNRCLTRLRKGRRCARYIRLRGSVSDSGRAGANSFRFSGRLNGKDLRRGRYRLVGVPRDASSNRGTSARASFRVARLAR